MRVDLPAAVRNPISLIGIAITTAMAIVFLALIALELGGQLRNPYVGLLLYVAVPAVFVFGLVLIAIGAWRQQRRVAAGATAAEWPVIDLGLPRTRSVVFGVALLTCVNILIVSLAAYGTVHHMETAEFCGTTCHTTMEPEWKAYQVSSHAEVACVSCHVGPGAEALVQSKINGTRQLWRLFTNNVPKPVPAPVHSMRAARETCQACHWAEKQHGDKLKSIREFADDEASTETVTNLQLHVGGGRADRGAGSGIHWHMNIDNRIEFISTDPQRQTIPWVKFTDRTGHIKEFTVDGVTPEQLAQGERRSMDCIDCHNRPAHTFEPAPERAVDNAIADGMLPRALPFARREAVAALKDTYASGDQARQGIEARLRKAFASHPAPAVDRVVGSVQEIYNRNVFPAMHVKWGTYPNNIGHVFFNGCFRCHDDNHKSRDGSVIKQDCESCHAMP
ncbi:MAG: NapC/NirT family cytochrome c [Vicinamibacterales bacterium]